VAKGTPVTLANAISQGGKFVLLIMLSNSATSSGTDGFFRTLLGIMTGMVTWGGSSLGTLITSNPRRAYEAVKIVACRAKKYGLTEGNSTGGHVYES